MAATSEVPQSSKCFKASRLTRNNHIFPTRIEVGPQHVVRIKPRLFGRSEESILVSKVASVEISTGILFSDIRIESTGGTDPIESHGHTKKDAIEIRSLIEYYQNLGKS